jgi:hypothetical protein
MDFALITNFIAPEWLGGTALVALIAAVAPQFSLESQDRDFQGADAWPPFVIFSSCLTYFGEMTETPHGARSASFNHRLPHL